MDRHLEELNMSKTIAHSLLGITLLVSVFGILATPSGAYAVETKVAAGVSARTGCGATCSYNDLVGADGKGLLPNFLKDLMNAQAFLKDNNYEDSIGVQSAINQVQEALKIQEPTDAWLVIGNAAAQSAVNAIKGVETLQNARNAIEQQKRLDEARAQCAADGPNCSEVTKKLIESLDASIIHSNNVVNGTQEATKCSSLVDFFKNPIVCVGRTIATVVSSILISIAAWALAIAGVLFNWAIMNSVILFKD